MALTLPFPPALAPDGRWLLLAVALDLVVGDPVYPLHPVRLIGRTLNGVEALLRRIGANGYAGGIALFVVLATMWVGALSAAMSVAAQAFTWLAVALHLFLLYSLLALGDLLHHVRRIEHAVQRDDITAARHAVSQLVGRDTTTMDGAACRRAAVESLSENLTDGFTSPLFWYVAAGIPGIVLFKVVSTMDSMVGYKTPRYLRFGWCGARLDDVMNFIPARLTWLLLAAVATVMPRCSGLKALRIGFAQHAVLPGPNSGWSEAAAAGALQRRLVGPIWMHDTLVTDEWIGDPTDPPLSTYDDSRTARRVVLVAGVAAAACACLVIEGCSAGLVEPAKQGQRRIEQTYHIDRTTGLTEKS
jgi:adenosylcobinamide-phosphate synthase